MEKSVSENVTQMWSDTLFGDIVQHEEAFPDVNDPRSKDTPNDSEKASKEVAWNPQSTSQSTSG